MNDITYKKAMAVLEELRKAITKAADTVDASKREEKK